METQESCMIVAEFILKLMTGLLPTEEAQYACVPTGSPPVVASGRSSWLSYKQMAITVAGVVPGTFIRLQLALSRRKRRAVSRTLATVPFIDSQHCDRRYIVDIWQLKWLATSLGHCLLAICRLLLGFHQPVIVAYSK